MRKSRTFGSRSRPRVAILGSFDSTELQFFKDFFPTTWMATDLKDLESKVSVLELDLMILGPDVTEWSNWVYEVHVICFAEGYKTLPSPSSGMWIELTEPAETEEHHLPELPLAYNKQLLADLGNVKSSKGWCRIRQNYHRMSVPTKESCETCEKILSNGSIISDLHTGLPFATIFLREDSNLGIAWLPQKFYNKAEWVSLICLEWAKFDEERFPDFRDWKKEEKWMVPSELEITKKISSLEQERTQSISRYDKEIANLISDLSRAKLKVDKGRRRLLTSQGNELVEEVADVFKTLGFEVECVDQNLSPDKPKREDLRLRVTSDEKYSWEAIVEVRGYKRKSGATADVSRLARFAEFYSKEKGRFPDKRIYVVNGQFELPPNQRRRPFESAQEDLEVFSEQQGIVISTIDLFLLFKGTPQKGRSSLRDDLKEARGRWPKEP
ncbi:hypothetical protein ACFLU6_09735 [Acidobacteriota bacterium]